MFSSIGTVLKSIGKLIKHLLQTAYEHSNDVKNAVIDLFEKITKTMIQQAPEMGCNFILMRKVRKNIMWLCFNQI